MLRRPSILSHRPKTSPAEEHPGSTFDTTMKRTASQTFCSQLGRDAGAPLGLDNIKEGKSAEYPHAQSHSSSASTHILSSFAQATSSAARSVRRRLSTSSSRRPSLSQFDGSPAIPQRKSSTDISRIPLQHQDSGMPIVQLPHEGAAPGLKSKYGVFNRFGSVRHRRPAASGPSGDTARHNPAPAPIPAGYFPPGSAARAAAAANNERLSLQKREMEQTERFLQSGLLSGVHTEDVTKDSESGVGMVCSSPIERTDSVQEKRMDPVQYLPAELTTMVLSNLDSTTLASAERISKAWKEAASSPHVWRSVFIRRFEPQVHVSPTPIMMGGAGIGNFKNGKPAPGQDWKKMYQARTTIDRSWERSEPRAIYLNGHTDSVYCCQFDENKIITGSRDQTIRVWDMKTYKCIKVIGGPNKLPAPNTPAELEVNKQMAVNHPSMNGTPAGRAIYHVPSDFHEASILCLQYDDKIMVTGSSDHTCIVWDITGEHYVPLYRLRRHSAGVLDVCLDDKHIISCSKDATINIWDRQTGHHIRELTGHRGPVNAVQLRGNLLVSASGDGVAKLWNLESGVCIKEFPSQDRGLAAVEFSDDAKYVLAGGNDHVVYKFDAVTGQLLHTSAKHGGLVRSLFLDAHNGRVISGSYDQAIRIAHYSTGQHFGHYENWTTSWILSAKSDYRRVVATSQDGRALILDFGWEVDGAEHLIGSA